MGRITPPLTDNTKVAVIKASLYDPQINRTYAEMAAHYGTAVLPARPRKPRDKAKVEQAVLIIERWLLGRLRHRVFYSLAEVNAAIGELLTRLNEERPIRRLGVTRRRLLEEVDRPALKPLLASPYVLAEWRIRRVSLDYHVEVEKHYYSVPHRFARAEVEVRFTARTVEIFHKGERIAAHQRMSGNHKHTTVPEHIASAIAATPAGPSCASVRTPPRSARRPAHCATSFSTSARTPNKASAPASASSDSPPPMGANGWTRRLRGRSTSARAPMARSSRSSPNNLDRRPAHQRSADDAPILHANIRGPRYYN